MQSVSICDTVTIEKSDSVTVDCSNKNLCGGENIACRAAELFFAAAKIDGGAKIYIEKRIPVAAGLGGGSADAAAVLCGLNTLYETRFDTKELCSIGAAVGADVPFCIAGGAAVCRGIGEKIEPIACLPDCFIVIAKQGNKSSTGALYALFDKNGSSQKPDTEAMKAALLSADIEKAAAQLCNAFEELVPQSAALKHTMLKCGALGAALSGSGPSVFGIFKKRETAQKCVESIGGQSFVCVPSQYGCIINSK
jgi:4-diphosphocytidyl-2-C-methyl-D-erythritol kinase